MATETLRVNQEGTTLDLLLWRRFGDERPFRVEAALAGNPDVADFGPFLPVGLQVEISVEDPLAAVAPIQIIRLWQ